jgi:hypothetical protein
VERGARRLRALILKGLTELESKVETMTVKELLTLIAQQSHLAAPEGKTDAGAIAQDMVFQRLMAEGVSQSAYDHLLLDVDKNPKYEQRRQELLRELEGDDPD